MRLVLALLAALLFATAPASARQDGPPLVMEQWFPGVTTGRGFVDIPLAGVRREFTMTVRSRWDGRVLTLVEDFVFADGERDRKTWRFTRVAPGRYVGRREDSFGPAEMRQDGNAVRMSYRLSIPSRTGGAPTVLGFEDILYLTSADVLINEAQVLFLGVPIGRSFVEFRRPPGGRAR